MRLFKRKAVVKNNQTPLPPQLASLLREAWWLLMAVLAVYLVLVLASYSSLDPSWSHSSSDPTVRNYGGAFGAWLSDMLLYVFGLSAWWLVVFCLVAIAWGYQRMETLGFKLNPITVAAIGGFLLLLFSSASIEAIILAEKALNLPLSAGGMFGHFIGLGIARGLGLSGAYLLLSVLAAIGFSLFTGLSWLDIMERLGGALEDGALKLWQQWQARRDREIGKEIAQKREEKITTAKKNEEKRRCASSRQCWTCRCPPRRRSRCSNPCSPIPRMARCPG